MTGLLRKSAEIISDEEAKRKFKWSGHTPFGDNTIRVVETYLLPLAKHVEVKSLLYKGGGSSGKPLQLKISQKVDIPHHLNVGVVFSHNTVNFIVILNDSIDHVKIPDFIQQIQGIYQSS
jgi:hypothetical protein